MSVRAVRWSAEALDEYDSAIAHLRAKNPAAAERYVEALDTAIAMLAPKHRPTRARPRHVREIAAEVAIRDRLSNPAESARR